MNAVCLQVLGSFASGNEGGTIVRVNGMAPSARPVPLSMLAQMDSSVHVEQYLRRLNECRELLPKVWHLRMNESDSCLPAWRA